MSSAPKRDSHVIPSALAAAERVAEQSNAAAADIASRPDREQWAEGERLLARVGHSARNLASQLSSLTVSDHS